jgi:hypothetical protein
MEARPPSSAFTPDEYCGATAPLQTRIERGWLSIRLTICVELTEPRSLRFYPAADVLPFSALLYFTRPSSPSERFIKITGAATGLHRGVTR